MKQRYLYAGGVILIVLACWWPFRQRGILVQRFPDGRWVGIQHVTTTTNGTHYLSLVGGWRRFLLHPIVPDRVRNWAGSGSVRMSGSPNSIGLWWTAGAGPGSSKEIRIGQMPDDYANVAWRIVDENDWVYAGNHRGYTSDGDGAPLRMTSFDTFPRRRSVLRVEMFHEDTRAVIASFRVPNPYPITNAHWVAAPLPATNTAGPVQVRLDSIEAVTIPPHETYPIPGLRFRFVPRFTLKSTEAPEDGWEATRVELSDPVGNISEYLDPSESAWKVTLELFPRPLTRRPTESNARWSGGTLRRPDPGSWAPLTGALTLDAKTYRIIGLGGIGIHTFKNGLHTTSQTTQQPAFEQSVSSMGTNSTVTLGRDRPMLCGTDWPPAPAGHRLVVRLRDPMGREFAEVSPMVADHFWVITLPGDCPEVFELEFAIQSSITTEFVASPPRLPEAKTKLVPAK